jgi:putative hemolysin
MRAKILNTPNEILEAQMLAYQVLVKEQNWEIKSGNPSNLHICKGSNGNKICDIYDVVSTWFGVFDNERLVACHRLSRRLNGKFEMELYHELPEFIRMDPNAVELNRLSVHKDYRKTLAFSMLTLAEYSYALENNYTYCFFSSYYPTPGKIFSERFGFSIIPSPFRYFHDDPQEVYLFYINFKDIPYMKNLMSRKTIHF